MPTDLWLLVIAYLVFGAVLIVSMRYFNLVIRNKQSKSEFAHDLMEAFKQDHPELNKSTIDKEQLFFTIIVCLIWPLAMLLLIIESLFPKLFENKPMPYNPEDDFECKRNHLVKKTTPEEAEVDSRIHDPLGRTPTGPFGHLEPGWRSFLALHEPGFELWSFKVPGNFNSFKAKKDNGREWSVPQDEKIGFAWVHKGKIKAEFLTEWD